MNIMLLLMPANVALKTRAGARERQKQIELARQRNQPHPLGRDPRQSTLEN